MPTRGLLTMGARIRFVRVKKLKIEQAELAARLGVSRIAVSKWENDRNLIKPKHLQKLAELTDLPEAWFEYPQPMSPSFLALWPMISIIGLTHDKALYEFMEMYVDWYLRTITDVSA